MLLVKFSCLEIPATERPKPENGPKINRILVIIIIIIIIIRVRTRRRPEEYELEEELEERPEK